MIYSKKEILLDPRKYATKLSIKDLVFLLNRARDQYYNTGKPMFSDKIFDEMEDVLREKDPNNRYFSQVGSPVKSVRSKVTLPYSLGSLDKVKTSKELNNFYSKYKEIVISDKLDGVSILLVAKDGEWKVYTRGNGVVGQDISYIGDALNIPRPPKSVVIRGELLVSKTLFDRKFADKAENPRNFVSGLANRKTVSKELGDVDFVAYELIKPSYKTEDQFKQLKRLGFKIPAFKVINTTSDIPFDLKDYFDRRKARSRYELDGLVLTANQVYKRPASGNPKYAVAYKSDILVQEVRTKVEKVVWGVSKEGFLKPVVHINPVRLSGVVIKRVTGNNYKFIKDNGIGKGSIINIIRSGDVIPKITKVVKKAKPDFPKVDYTINSTGVEAVADLTSNLDLQEKMKIKKILHFLRTMEVDGVGEGIITKLVVVGGMDLNDIIHMKVKDLLEFEGFKYTSAQKFVDAIDDAVWSTEGVDASRLMDASGVFGRGIGTRRVKPFVDQYPDFLEMNSRELKQALLTTPGISSILAKQIVSKMPDFKRFVKSTGIKISMKKKKASSGKLKGMTVVFTGYRDKGLEKLITDNGGKVGSSVSKNTSILTYEGSRASSKLKKAHLLDIPVMTRDKFMIWLDKNI